MDNKPSNHAAEVEAVLDDTLKLRARPFTPTDKAHVEGAFGLFAQQEAAAPHAGLDADRERLDEACHSDAARLVKRYLERVTERGDPFLFAKAVPPHPASPYGVSGRKAFDKRSALEMRSP